MKNILHLGIFNDHDLGLDFRFENGFQQNKIDVTRFSYRDIAKSIGIDEMNEELVKEARKHECVFMSKGELVSVDALKEIKKSGAQIVLYYCDLRRPIQNWLKERLTEVDVFFMSTGGEDLKKYHKSGKPGKSAFVFNPSDPHLLEKYSYIKSSKNNVIITGKPYDFETSRIEAIKTLSKRNDVKYYGGIEKLKGFTNFPILNKFILKYYDYRKKMNMPINTSPVVRGEDYVKVIKNSKIGIGVNGYQSAYKYTSARLTHFLEFGTFFLQKNFSGVEKIFSPNEDLAIFYSIDELNEKIDYYLSHEDERKKIAHKGQKRILEEYNSKNITAYMIDVIRNKKHGKFEWEEIIKDTD